MLYSYSELKKAYNLKWKRHNCADMFSFHSGLFIFKIMRTNFGNCRRKLDQSIIFATKDWQNYLVVVVKMTRGCPWLNICPMKHS